MTKYLVLLPEALVVAGAVVVLLLARFGPSRYRRWRRALPAVAALILLAALAVELRVGADVGSYFGGELLVDRFGLFVKAAVLLAAAVGIAVADWGAEDSMSIGLAMPMLPVFGVMVVASGGDFLSVWAGLELAGAAGVVMLATRRPDSALRLLLLGAAASALMLIGLAYVYATAGSADLSRFPRSASARRRARPGRAEPDEHRTRGRARCRRGGGGGGQGQRRGRRGLSCVLALRGDRRRGGDGGRRGGGSCGPLASHAHSLPGRGPDRLGHRGPRHTVPRRNRRDDLPARRPGGRRHRRPSRRRGRGHLGAGGLRPGYAASRTRRGPPPRHALARRRPANGGILRRVHDRRSAGADRPPRAAGGGLAGIASEPGRGNRDRSRPLPAEPAERRPARTGRPAGLDPPLGVRGDRAVRRDRRLRPVGQPDLE